MRAFWKDVIVPNRWRYLVVIAICFGYAFGITRSGPRYYRSEAVLAFKNRETAQAINAASGGNNPPIMVLDEVPIEDQYDYSVLLYSINLANRVLGDRFDQVYKPEDFDGLYDFYTKFLSLLGYEYDGDQKVIKLSFTYKDPKLAAEFVNRFGRGLEDYMQEAVERSYMTPVLRTRLAEAQREAADAESLMRKIAEEYKVPDLLKAPAEWAKAYADAVERTIKSDVQVESTLAALRQVQKNKEKRNLLKEPEGTPDSTIIRDVVLAALRLKYATLNIMDSEGSETLAPGSPGMNLIKAEKSYLEKYIEQQYRKGYDAETTTLQMRLQKYMVQNYLRKARAKETYKRLEELPRLEREVRPTIRHANVATATVVALERMSSFTEIGESYGVHPIKVVDNGIPPDKPIEPAWRILSHLAPTALFLSTLWFALIAIMVREDRAAAKISDVANQEEDAK